MRAIRSPLPPGHQECRRCSALVADGVAACLCPDCVERLLAVEALVDRIRERQRRRLAATAGVEYITPVEAADLLGLSDRHVRRLATEGKIPARRILGRVWLPKPAVLALIHDGAA